jgi:hypothetical protein
MVLAPVKTEETPVACCKKLVLRKKCLKRRFQHWCHEHPELVMFGGNERWLDMDPHNGKFSCRVCEAFGSKKFKSRAPLRNVGSIVTRHCKSTTHQAAVVKCLGGGGLTPPQSTSSPCGTPLARVTVERMASL